MNLSLLLLSILLLPIVSSTPIYFGFVATDSTAAAQLTPVLQYAVELINSDPAILPGYQLQYETWLSQCDRTVSLNAFLDHVLVMCDGSAGGPTILGLVGTGCTAADLPVAELIHRWNIPQVSYVGESEVIRESERFPGYHQLYSLESLVRGLEGLLTAFSWDRLVVVSDNHTRFTQLAYVINKTMSISNVSQWTVSAGNVSGTMDSVPRDYRVLYLNTYQDTARDIICYAVEMNLTSPRYSWIVNGWYSEEWWVSSEPSSCTDASIRDFLDTSRVLVLQPSQAEGDIIGGITRAQFYEAYRASQLLAGVRYVPEAPVVYDSIWALALALNSTIANQTPASNSCTSGLPLEQFSYSSGLLGSEILAAITNTSFNGASGNVVFDNGIRRQDLVTVSQYRDGGIVEIGTVDLSAVNGTLDLSFVDSENQSTVFPGVLPLDGTPVKVIVTYQPWLLGLCYTLAIIGLICVFICFLFNLIFRKRRVVRLTSPNLNYFILLGTSLVYCTIFVYLLKTTDPTVYKIRCYVQTWTVTLGVTLCFGTVIAKLYRVVHIFKNPSPDKKIVRDWKLVILILLILVGGVLLLVLRLIIPVFRIEPSLTVDSGSPSGVNDLGVTEIYCSWRCIGDNPVVYYYQIIYYIVMVLMLICAMYFAVRTRGVKVKVLNDYKWIAGVVYAGVPITVIFFVLTFSLTSYIHLSAALYCVGLFFMSTLFLGLVFVPKMVALVKDPKGEKIFGRQPTIHSSDGSRRNTSSKEKRQRNGHSVRDSAIDGSFSPVLDMELTLPKTD